jgi:hypothetical protein
LQRADVALHLVGPRPHGFAFTHDFQSHTLPDVTQGPSVFDQGFGGPAEHVNKPRSHGESAAIDLGCGVPIRDIAEGDDAVIFYGHVADKGRGAGTVVEGSAAKDPITGGIHGRRGPGRAAGQNWQEQQPGKASMHAHFSSAGMVCARQNLIFDLGFTIDENPAVREARRQSYCSGSPF